MNLMRSGLNSARHAYIASRRLMELVVNQPYSRDYAGLVGRGIDAYYTSVAQAYAFFPMLATQSASPSDHFFASRKKPIRRLIHLITRTRARDWLRSYLMRPAELMMAVVAVVTLGIMTRTIIMTEMGR